MLEMAVNGRHVYEVSIYNKEVRAMVKENQHHHFFDDQWADIHIRNVTAHDEGEAVSIISKRFPTEDGFVIEQIMESNL
ncbi:MAG TPA: hypothetical protein QGG18_03875 [Rhodospirillales bacterium]|nr:hypothetical protein [Chloroflexota bacterium]HJN24819.1 hypothetical protein [Rhodospirillales bacterium]|tara:strand:- start:3087 stop:3323 length:237 start_codon:yes stop_codon:yes gene_type:complete